MEADLRRREKEKRTLHWFVRGKQQRVFIKGVPDRVEFAVCYSNYSSDYISISFIFYLISIQVCTGCKDASVECIRLEELQESTVHWIEGEVGKSW